MLFLISQNHLSDLATEIENAQALSQSIESDKAQIEGELFKGQQLCMAKFPRDCKLYLDELLILRNRSDDYVAALRADFQAPGRNDVIVKLNRLSASIAKLADGAFGFPFAKAKSLGIVSSEAYINYIIKRRVQVDYAALEAQSHSLYRESTEAFEALRLFSKTYGHSIPSFGDAQRLTRNLYWVIVLAEILVFSLVGILAFVNTTAQEKSKRGA